MLYLTDQWYENDDEWMTFEEFMFELEREHVLTEWARDELMIGQWEEEDDDGASY